MKKSTKLTNLKENFQGTFGSMGLIADDLPSPEELVRKHTSHKITIALSDDSINFFKDESKKLNTPYQRLIKNLLQEYVDITRMGKGSHQMDDIPHPGLPS